MRVIEDCTTEEEVADTSNDMVCDRTHLNLPPLPSPPMSHVSSVKLTHQCCIGIIIACTMSICHVMQSIYASYSSSILYNIYTTCESSHCHLISLSSPLLSSINKILVLFFYVKNKHKIFKIKCVW